MENKHFSHIHVLSPHQMPEGTQITCSGCKFQISGKIYACWKCNFLLHEQCFNATRAMQHPSHPSHPLNLTPYPTYPSNSIYCNHCKQLGSGFSYTCSLCEFDLHVHCAYMTLNNPPENHHILHQTTPSVHLPIQNLSLDRHDTQTPTVTPSQVPSHENISGSSKIRDQIKHFSHEHPLHQSEIREKSMTLCSGCDEIISGPAYKCKEFPCNFNLHKTCFHLPQQIQHKAHPKHSLSLILLPQDSYGGCICDACHKNCFGLIYNCSSCNYHLHVHCSSLPAATKHGWHQHPLSLFYHSPYKKVGEENGSTFGCDSCYRVVSDASWVYYCRKCDFGVHTYCLPAGIF